MSRISLESQQAYRNRPRLVRCDRCEGNGYLLPNRAELHEIMDLEQMRLRRRVDVVKIWQDTGKVECPDCEGKGKWEIE